MGGKLVPNAGFLPTAVVPLGSGSEALEGDDDASNGDGEASGTTEGEHCGTDMGVKGSDGPTAIGAAALDIQGLSLGDNRGDAAGGRGSQLPGAAPESMDELLELTLLQASACLTQTAGRMAWVFVMFRPLGGYPFTRPSWH